MIAPTAVLEASLACLPPGGPARSSGQDLGLRSQAIGRFGFAISIYRYYQNLEPSLLKLVQTALDERRKGLITCSRRRIDSLPTITSTAYRPSCSFLDVHFNARFLWHNALPVMKSIYLGTIIGPIFRPCQDKKSKNERRSSTVIQNS